MSDDKTCCGVKTRERGGWKRSENATLPQSGIFRPYSASFFPHFCRKTSVCHRPAIYDHSPAQRKSQMPVHTCGASPVARPHSGTSSSSAGTAGLSTLVSLEPLGGMRLRTRQRGRCRNENHRRGSKKTSSQDYSHNPRSFSPITLISTPLARQSIAFFTFVPYFFIAHASLPQLPTTT